MKKQKTVAQQQIEKWAKLYVESLTEDELSHSTSDSDLLNTCFSTLLRFMVGDGNSVLKDEEWMLYLINDINAAIDKGLFNPQFDDKQNLKKINAMHFGADIDESDEDTEDSEDSTEDSAEDSED